MVELRRILDYIVDASRYLSPILIFSGIIIIIVGAIIIPVTSNDVKMTPVGHLLVSSEIDIIPGVLFMKPITLAVCLIALGYLLGLEYLDMRLKLSRNSVYVIAILSLFFMFISLYEVMYNFMLWGSLISSLSQQGLVKYNIDTLANTFPNPDHSWNLVFATKIFSSILFLSTITFLYTLKWRR